MTDQIKTMQFVHQSIRHDPDNGAFGDCHRAAIATVLGLTLDDVPHFLHDGCNGEEFAQREARFLARHGLVACCVPFAGDSYQHVLETMLNINGEDFVCLLGGTSRSGCNHTVVCRGSEIVHDPSPVGSGVIGPCDDGFYWLTFFCRLDVSRQALPEVLPQPHRQSA